MVLSPGQQWDFLYLAFRGATGFTLAVVGLGYLFGARHDTALRASGAMFLAGGGLFLLSALDPVLPLPVEIGNLAVAALVFAISQAFFELTLSLFGDLRARTSRRVLYWTGAGLTILLWALPLLDSVLGVPGVGVSIEDGASLGPIHQILGPLVYLWPIAVVFFSARMGGWGLRDLRASVPGLGVLGPGLMVLGLLLVAILVSSILGDAAGYRWSHTGLELWLLGFYFFLNRHPERFEQLRWAVSREKERERNRDRSETEMIAARLDQLAANPTFLRRPGLTLQTLAHRIGVPAYRLSEHFNREAGTTFPAWLNLQRITWVRNRLDEDPGTKILDLAFAAGYRSKTAFNDQFLKLVGTAPSAYRKPRTP
jgi:AraC-like DNA-binding protein